MDKGKARQPNHPAIQPGADPPSASPLSYNQLIDHLIHFLEVAFHTILAIRAVYPHDVFTRRKKYCHPCYQSRHPGLNEYIARVLRSVKHEVQHSKVDKVVLVIRPNSVVAASSSSSASRPSPSAAYERFTFALDYLLPASAIDARNRDLALSHNLSQAELDVIFRGFLQKLMVVDGALYDLPTSAASTRGSQGDGGDELTFAIVLEMKDEGAPPSGTGKDQPATGDWVFADDDNLGRMRREQQRRTRAKEAKARRAQVQGTEPSQSQDGSDDDDDDDTTRPVIRPVKTLDSGVINLALYVEEDLLAKLGPLSSSSTPQQRRSSASLSRAAAADRLLSSKASQLLDSDAGARLSKNAARRRDGERELDEPPLPEGEGGGAGAKGKGTKAAKRKRARMTLGDTRAAESESESESSDSVAPGGSAGSDVDMRDGEREAW